MTWNEDSGDVAGSRWPQSQDALEGSSWEAELRWLEGSLGTLQRLDVLAPRVLRLRGDRGEGVWKLARSDRAFQQERQALLSWPESGSAWRRPRLLAEFSSSMRPSLLIEYCPGRGVESFNEEERATVFESAGRALRDLHGASRERSGEGPDIDLAEALALRAQKTLRDLPSLELKARERSLVERLLSDWTAWRGQKRVCCHGDFEPRNWIREESGDLVIIDFEHARQDHPTWDWLRLREDDFGGDARAREAFRRGYGRGLDDVDERSWWRLDLLHALRTLLWAQRHQEGQFVIRAKRHLLRCLGEDAEARFG